MRRRRCFITDDKPGGRFCNTQTNFFFLYQVPSLVSYIDERTYPELPSSVHIQQYSYVRAFSEISGYLRAVT